ncbi:MAG TPA: polyprenyl synthetase family protein [Jatrophihabitans sp.]|nr:polyprenyl synthetase family protein [Jatrophihabitans sp.]
MRRPGDFVIDRVDAELTAVLDDRARVLSAIGDDLVPICAAARTFVLDGGKRLRPTFAYWGWRAVHDADADDRGLITAAASLELLHACALAHDDVMDASDTRRGRESAHAAFARLHREHSWTGDAEVFGTAAAIVLGDLLLSWADAMFATAAIEAAAAPRARSVYDEMRQLVMAGQYLDVLVQARGAFSADEALRVIEFKTSKYTVEGPLHLGAAVASAPEHVFAVLTEYGLALGEAFQLRDDVLGVFGDPSVTGKPAGDDLREGKHTLLTALAMSEASSAQAAALRAGLGDRALDEEQVAALREVIVSTGALARVEERIAQRTAQARAAAQSPALGADARAALAALAEAATNRHA